MSFFQSDNCLTLLESNLTFNDATRVDGIKQNQGVKFQLLCMVTERISQYDSVTNHSFICVKENMAFLV